jgi:hypothetical protein
MGMICSMQVRNKKFIYNFDRIAGQDEFEETVTCTLDIQLRA